MIGMRDIELLKNGDLEAFERVYRAFWNKVYQFSGLFIDDDFEREDIVQEGFLRIWNKRNLIDSGKDFNGFLFITTRNIVFNRLRTTDRKERIEKVAEKIGLEYSPDVESNIDADFYKKNIDKLIALLPERQREAFCLSRKGNLPIKKIAERMGITESAVKRHINLALKFLKANLPLLIIFLKG